MARSSIWGPRSPAPAPAGRSAPAPVGRGASIWTPQKRNPLRDDAPTLVVVRSFRAMNSAIAKAEAGTGTLPRGITSERFDAARMLRDRIAAGDADVPPDVRASVAEFFAQEPGAPAMKEVAGPPPKEVAAELAEVFGPVQPRRTVPGMAAPARPARSAKLAAAEQQRRVTTAPVRGMSEEEFYKATGTTSRVTDDERAKWAERARQSRVHDDLEIVREAPAPPRAPPARTRLPQLTGEDPPEPKTAKAARASARLQRTQGLPDDVEEEVTTVFTPPPSAKRLGARSETTGKTYLRSMDLPQNAPVFTLGSTPAMPTMKRGGHGKTRGPMVEAGAVTLEPGWIRGIGCGDARYDKAGIAVLVNGQFSGRWATSWEAATELARRLLAVVAKNNPKRPWAPVSRAKTRKATRPPGWINKRGAR